MRRCIEECKTCGNLNTASGAERLIEKFAGRVDETYGALSEEIVDIKNLIGDAEEEDGIGRVTGTIVSVRDALPVLPTVMNVYGRTSASGVNSNDPGFHLYHRGKNLLVVDDTVLTSDDGKNKEIWLDYTKWRGVIEGNTYTISLRAIGTNVVTGRLRINVWGGTSNSVIASSLQSNLGDCDLYPCLCCSGSLPAD